MAMPKPCERKTEQPVIIHSEPIRISAEAFDDLPQCYEVPGRWPVANPFRALLGVNRLRWHHVERYPHSATPIYVAREIIIALTSQDVAA